MEKSGIFALISVNDKESELFLTYLRSISNTTAFDFVNYLLGKDYLQFIDLLAGSTIKIPNRKILYRDIEYIKIYSYIKEHGYTADSVRCVAKIYNKNISFVKRVFLKISKTLNDEEALEKLKDLNNIKINDNLDGKDETEVHCLLNDEHTEESTYNNYNDFDEDNEEMEGDNLDE